MRDTGKLLEPYGFEGEDPRWVRTDPGGVAVVERTRTLRSFTAGQQELTFGLRVQATPLAWWEFRAWRDTRDGLPVAPLEAATGPGVIDADTLPPALTEPWSLRLDTDAPGHVLTGDVSVIREELPKRVHAYARRALRLLQPGAYLEELLAQPDPTIATWEAIVVLLAGEGPDPRLDDALDHLAHLADEEPSPDALDVIDYARCCLVGAEQPA